MLTLKSKLISLLLTAFICLVAFVFWANHTVNKISEPYLTSTPDNLENFKAALLLGTSKTLKNGTANLYFKYRIETCVKLFKSGKVQYIIVSGDNSKTNYNEPEDMKQALLKNGIPDSCIYLDFAGLRTFDSVIRAKEIFGQQRFVVVSQKFHNQRAICIGRRYGIAVYGLNAPDVAAFNGFKTKLREYFARVKMFLDFWVNQTPKHLGNPIILGSNQT
jgi:SanA protein